MSKVKDTNGREHTWNLSGTVPEISDIRPRSALHIKARALLKEMFPLDQICEEVELPGERLYADFFLPLRKFVVEVHGEQHFKYNSHFHGSLQEGGMKEFTDSIKRDVRKAKWCEINNIVLVVLPYNKEAEWKNLIANR
jgi:hypothetical protein